jgi:hypothetical protein
VYLKSYIFYIVIGIFCKSFLFCKRLKEEMEIVTSTVLLPVRAPASALLLSAATKEGKNALSRPRSANAPPFGRR